MTVESWRDSVFMRACRREPVPYTPVWLMRQAGRYQPWFREIRARVPFLELCKTPSLVAEVTVRAAEQLGVDAAIIFADLLLPVEPMGFDLDYVAGDGPKIFNPVRCAADLTRLREVEPGALDYVIEGIRQARAALPANLPLIGFASAPFTLVAYLIEGGGSRRYEATKTFMYQDEGAWHALMEHAVRALGPYLNAQIDAGAGAVQIFDSWAGWLSPRDYRRYVLPHTRALIGSVRPGTPVIHFATDNSGWLEIFAEAGGDVIGLDWRVSLAEGWRRAGDRAIMGNLDPVVLQADRKTIREQAAAVLAEAAGRPGHIFNLGHGILPPTPVEHAIALVEAVHELSDRRN